MVCLFAFFLIGCLFPLRLGRDKASAVLTQTLQCFFTCFDAVHHGRSSLGSPPAKHDKPDPSTPPTGLTSPKAPTEVTSHPLTPGAAETTEDNDRHANLAVPLPASTTSIENKEPYQQVCATFSSAMAHAAYIPFCLLLGQIRLNTILINTELIENIAYGHDKVAKADSPLPSVWELDPEPGSWKLDRATQAVSESDSESSSGEESDDDEEEGESVVLKLGPVVALQGKSGLGDDSSGFGRSNWFVDLERGEGGGEGAGLGGGGGGGATTKGGEGGGGNATKLEDGAQAARGGGEGLKSAGGGASAGLQQRSSSFTEGVQDGPTRSEVMDRQSASFFAKFSSVEKTSSGAKQASSPG